jgi:RNA polymerase sigma-B factor
MTNATLNDELPRTQRRHRTTDLLARAAAAAGEDRAHLIEEVVLANTGVARSIAQRYAGRGVPLQDLEQVAYLALVRAAQKFDGDRAEDFLVYAVPTIRGEIKRWFRDHGWTVRPPRRLQELQGAVLRARAEASRELTPPELAQRLGVSEDEVQEALKVRGCFSPNSLDAPAEPGGEGTLGSMLPGDDGGLGASENRVLLEQAMKVLTPRERLVVRLRYSEDMTQAEIGEVIGVTQMQVSRILNRVTQMLRNELKGAGVAA